MRYQLEQDASADLELPHGLCASNGSCSLRVIDAARRIVWIDKVEDVSRLDSALQLHTLPEFEIPEQRCIDALGTWSGKVVAPRIAV